MLVSVIIPTRNRAALLSAALAALARQVCLPRAFEVLVVDNGSTDATAQVVEAARAMLPRLRYLYEPRPGLHQARHCGLTHAEGEILAYIDDDVQVASTWIAGLTAAFADERVGLVGGSNLPQFAAPPPPWLARLWSQRRSIPYLSVAEHGGAARDIDPALVWGCNFSIRRSALVHAGGFHPDAMPEALLKFRGDGEMPVGRHVVASGLRCLLHPEAWVHHLVPSSRMTLGYFRRRAYMQGVSDSFTELRARHLDGAAPPEANGTGELRAAARHALQLLADPALGRLALATRGSHRAGRRWHASLFASDPEVRAWVLRPTFLETAPCA